LAVVVTIAKGYDLGYIWKTQDHIADRTIGGYFIDAAQAGEPPGRWWGPGAQALGLAPGQTVERKSYDAIYRQTDPRTGARLGRPRGRYPTFADHLARLTAAEPHATAERLIELEREAAQATRQPAAYYDVTISYVGHAEKWDEILIDGDVSEGDFIAGYRLGDKILAVASCGRDKASLEAEAHMETEDWGALAKMFNRTGLTE